MTTEIIKLFTQVIERSGLRPILPGNTVPFGKTLEDDGPELTNMFCQTFPF
jgi:hypothetical protein